VRRIVAAIAGTLGCLFVFVGLGSLPLWLLIPFLPFNHVLMFVILVMLMLAVAVHVGRLLYRLTLRAGQDKED
jgi:hypothetical protein